MSSSAPQLLRKLKLYQTKARLYLVGRTHDKLGYRVTKFSRQTGVDLQATDDPSLYTETQCKKLLSSINDGNKAHGGLTLVLEADALIGCFRFLEGYYLLFVTQKKLVGNICGTDKIYSIADIRLVALNYSADRAAHEGRDERRYRKVLSCVELTKNFFFSYSWPLWRTVQASLSCESKDAAWDSMFVWNNYLTRCLRGMIDPQLWVMPLIHGHWQQRTLAISSQTLTITLIARRSKYFAGTRYRKRGINDQGHVANDVEIEQVVSAGFDWRTGFPLVASIVQMRGSIPLFWIQDYNQRKLKPDILLQRFDPLFDATKLHFQDLSARYGNPIVVLNLVKSAEKRPREQLLRTEFGNAISHINKQRVDEEKIVYIPWDFNFWAKRRGSQILPQISPVIKQSLQLTSLYVCAPAAAAAVADVAVDSLDWNGEVSFQRGVLRTNCIDCLDRTNVAQFALGLHALGLQLQALGVSDGPELDTRSSMAVELMSLYEQMGDVLARQYGGSEAHSTIFRRQRGDWEYATAIGDKLTTLRRYYSNTYTDAEKQDALNLFLGNFIPVAGQPAIWDLDSDYYLHSGLGQRFLKSLLEKAEQEAGGDGEGSSVQASTATSPRLMSGHLEGEGVRNYAALLAAARSVKRPARASGLPPLPTSPHGLTERLASTEEESPDAASAKNNTTQQEESAVAPLETPLIPEAARPSSRLAGEPLAQQAALSVASAAEASQQSFREKDTHSNAAAEPHRLPKMHPGESRGQVLKSVQRAHPAQSKRAKLESFDRKLGRPPNAILQVKLDTSASGSSTFLPQWLASPLGMTRSTRPSTDVSPHGSGALPRINLARLLSRRPNSLDVPDQIAVAGSLSAPPVQVDRPSLERRSADSSHVRLRPSGRPIARSASDTWEKWNPTVKRDIQEALSENITQPGWLPLAAPPNTFAAFPEDDSSCFTDRHVSSRLPLQAASSTELAESLLSKPTRRGWSDGTKRDTAFVSRQADSLGLSPGIQAWLTESNGPGQAWENAEGLARASYSRYLGKTEQLADTDGEAADKLAEYSKLCSFESFQTSCADANSRRPRYRRCVDMRAWGEAAIKRLAMDRAAV